MNQSRQLLKHSRHVRRYSIMYWCAAPTGLPNRGIGAHEAGVLKNVHVCGNRAHGNVAQSLVQLRRGDLTTQRGRLQQQPHSPRVQAFEHGRLPRGERVNVQCRSPCGDQ